MKNNIWLSGAGLLLGLALGSSPAYAAERVHHSGWIQQNAVRVEIAFWDGQGPHWGAFFYSAHTPYDQHYAGSGGDAATASYSGGIPTWNWWGSTPSTLLLPKSWIATGPWGEPVNPAKYNALCAR